MKIWAILIISLVGVIFVTSTIFVSAQENGIPSWIKDTATWWGEGKISDKDFINALQWLINEEILKVPQTNEMPEELEIKEINFDKISFEITGIEELVRNSEIRQALISSNQEFEKLDDAFLLIDKRDEDWRAADFTEITPFMAAVINNEVSEQIRQHANLYKESAGYTVYSEIFVTNSYGANVAQTGKTSDYKQDDEQWWIRAKQDGLYISEVHYDESAGVYSTDIALRINDNIGSFLGVIKAVTNVDEPFKSFE